VPSINFATLKILAPMKDVLRLLRWKPSEVSGQEQRGPCPIHGSSSPASRSFAVRGDGFYCHSCKANGDQLRLYSLVSRLPVYAAAQQLAELLVFPMPYLPRVRKPRNRRAEQDEER
jgi:DNA primase